MNSKLLIKQGFEDDYYELTNDDHQRNNESLLEEINWYTEETIKKLTVKEEKEIVKDVLMGNKEKFIKQYTMLIYYIINSTLEYCDKVFDNSIIDDIHVTILSYLFDNGIKIWDSKKGRKLSSWIGLIAMSRTMDYLKKSDALTQVLPKNLIYFEEYDSMGSELNENLLDKFLIKENIFVSLDIEEELDHKMQINLVRQTIEELNPLEQKIIKYHLKDLPNEKIGKIIGVKISDIPTQKHRAIRKLKKIIKKKLKKNGQID